jgi:hypothetical protein
VNCDKQNSTWVWAALVIVTAATLASGDVSDNPYQTIIDRNAFGLKPIPTVDTNTNSPLPIPGNLKFTGITKVGDVKKAFFMDIAKNPPTYFALGEGEQQESLKVIKIDEKEGAADIFNGVISTRVTFETHGNKNVTPGLAPLAAPKMPAPVPSGIPGAAPGAPGFPPGNPPSIPTPNANPGANPRTFPSVPNPGYTGAPAQEGMRMIPTRSVRVQPQQQQPASTLSAEASAALMMINREVHKDAIDRKELPPLPDPTQ